jgi:hypothetical protein
VVAETDGIACLDVRVVRRKAFPNAAAAGRSVVEQARLCSLCQRCHMIHHRPHHLAQGRISYLLRRPLGDSIHQTGACDGRSLEALPSHFLEAPAGRKRAAETPVSALTGATFHPAMPKTAKLVYSQSSALLCTRSRWHRSTRATERQGLRPARERSVPPPVRRNSVWRESRSLRWS